MRFQWLGQGGYLFESGGVQVCVDPYLSDSLGGREGHARLMPPPMQPEDLRADLIVCTHDHGDHLDPGTIARTYPPRHLYAGPPDVVRHLGELFVPSDRVRPLAIGDALCVGPFRVRAVAADHGPSEAIGVVLAAEGLSVYVAADTEYSNKLTAGLPTGIDALFCCINGKWGNMTGEEALKVYALVGASAFVPSHYGMFPINTADPRAVEVACRLRGILCFVHARPGVWYDMADVMGARA